MSKREDPNGIMLLVYLAVGCIIGVPLSFAAGYYLGPIAFVATIIFAGIGWAWLYCERYPP